MKIKIKVYQVEETIIGNGRDYLTYIFGSKDEVMQCIQDRTEHYATKWGWTSEKGLGYQEWMNQNTKFFSMLKTSACMDNGRTIVYIHAKEYNIAVEKNGITLPDGTESHKDFSPVIG